MARRGHLLCLLAYDIADRKRLVRVHHACREWGVPIQYSVFLLPVSPAKAAELFEELRNLVDVRVDDVRLYPLTTPLEMEQVGRRGLLQGVELVDARCGMGTVAALAASRGIDH